MKKTTGIYKIINCIDGKVYIGQSINIENRFIVHISNINNNKNSILYNTIRKYGIENFEFIIIEEIVDVNKLDERETYWIGHYKSNDRNYGYNIRLDCRTNRGFKHSVETKNKISNKTKGRKHSIEHRLKISNKTKGRVPWNKGIKMSQESIKKRTQSRKNYKHSNESKLKMSLSKKGKKRGKYKKDKNNVIIFKQAV